MSDISRETIKLALSILDYEVLHKLKNDGRLSAETRKSLAYILDILPEGREGVLHHFLQTILRDKIVSLYSNI